MKLVSVLGKGPLAIKIAEWFDTSRDYQLWNIVSTLPEPTWCESLGSWAINNDINIVDDHNKLPSGLLIFSVFYEKILKKDFIDRQHRVLNLHSAPLPKYRGVRPINWALKNRENHHGITIHEITPGIDDGPILGKMTYPIYPDIESVKDVYDKSLDYGFILFKDVMSKIDKIVPKAQDETEAVYYSNKDIKLLGEHSGW